MAKSINYYKGIALSVEEQKFKDYSDKYLSLFVDLIRSGEDDVIFFKDANNFLMEKVSGTSPEKLLIREGFCLFQKINDFVDDFEFNDTLLVEDYPDQRFFVKSEEKTVTIAEGTALEKRYVYLQNFLAPAAFSCTVALDGTLTITDNGSIKKTEVPAIIRNSNSKSPTRVRFMGLDYSMSAIVNDSVYEINSFTDDIVILNGVISAEPSEVLCVPIGSFDLGSENNLPNRALFGNLETRVIVSTDDDLDDTANGIVKIGYITFTSATAYDITDLRNDNKYIISIDTDVDLTDFVTKSTNQVIEGEKYFKGLQQNWLTNLNYANNFSGNFIDINQTGFANEFIFDCQNTASLLVAGFKCGARGFGTNPETNIVPGTSIKVRFKNIGTNSKFNPFTFNLPSTGVLIKAGVLYTIRYDEDFVTGGFTFNMFSLSDSASIWDVNALQTQISANASNISIHDSIISGMEFVVKAELPTLVGAVENTDVELYVSYIKKGTDYLVTLHAKMASGLNISLDNGTVPLELRTGGLIKNLWTNISDERVYIVTASSGQVDLKNETATSAQISVTYIAGI